MLPSISFWFLNICRMEQLRPTVFTCLAIHPTLSIAAVGDSNGAILLWYFSAESSELSHAPGLIYHPLYLFVYYY